MESAAGPSNPEEIQETSSGDKEIPGTSAGNKEAPGRVYDVKRRRSAQGTGNSRNKRRQKANTAKKAGAGDANLENGIFYVDKILDKRVEDDGQIKFLIKWEGYSSNYNTWEPKDNISPPLIEAFENAQANKKHIAPKLRFKMQPPLEENIANENETLALEVEIEDSDADDNTAIIEYSEDDANKGEISTVGDTVSARSVLNEVKTNIAAPNDEENISADVLIEDGIIIEQEDDQILSETETIPNKENVELQFPLVKFESDGFRILSSETNVSGKALKQIMSATSYRGETIFLVDFEDADDYVLVKASCLNVAFPQQVIKYYEERITWSDPGEEEEDI